MAVGSINSFVRGSRSVVLTLLIPILFGITAGLSAHAQESNPFAKLSSSSQRKKVLANLPMHRLTPQARTRILSIAKSPTFYRRLPTQAIDCDRDMFLFLTRNSEALVGLWELMGITQVQTRRTGKYQLEADDGAGTTCTVDLIYGDSDLHIFVADGMYDGKMTPRPIKGSGVFVLRSAYTPAPNGSTTVTGTLDVFVQFNGIGTDLIVRTLSGVIGRSADNNYVETARFIGQVSQASRKNPPAMIDVANRLPQVDEVTRQKFADVIRNVAARSAAPQNARPRLTAPAAMPRTATRTMLPRTK